MDPIVEFHKSMVDSESQAFVTGISKKTNHFANSVCC